MENLVTAVGESIMAEVDCTRLVFEVGSSCKYMSRSKMKLDVIKEWELIRRVSIHMSASQGSRVWQWDQHSPSADPAVPKLSLLKWQSGQQLA